MYSVGDRSAVFVRFFVSASSCSSAALFNAVWFNTELDDDAYHLNDDIVISPLICFSTLHYCMTSPSNDDGGSISYVSDILITVMQTGMTDAPTMLPTAEPTEMPTFQPTFFPSLQPTTMPTHLPTATPSEMPTAMPTFYRVPIYVTVSNFGSADCLDGLIKTITIGAEICLPVQDSELNNGDLLLGVMYRWNNHTNELTVNYYSDSNCATMISTGLVYSFPDLLPDVCLPGGITFSVSYNYTLPDDLGFAIQ
jgi:hypothetical protein